MDKSSDNREIIAILAWSLLLVALFTYSNFNTETVFKKDKPKLLKLSYSIANYSPQSHRKNYINFVNRKSFHTRAASSFLLGKKLAPDDFRKAFKENGLIHLLTPSAIHMVFVCGFIILLLKPVLNLFFSVEIKSKIIFLLLLISSTLYLQWSDFQESAGRASTILMIFSILGVLRKAYSGFQILFLFSAGMLLVSPKEISCLSFQYSIMAYLALAASRKLKEMPLVKVHLKTPTHISIMKIKEILFIQFIITLFLAPIQLSLNQELTPWGLLLNPIAIPYSVFILLPLSLAAFIVFPFSVEISEIFLLLASKGSGILLNVIDSKSSILISLIFLLFFIKYGIRLLSSPKLMGLLKIFLTTQIAFSPLSTGLENSRKISFLNVGQGDSMIYETSNCNLFIDTGKFKDFKRDLISKAKEQELIIITHPHADHYGGLSKLINKARTPVIYLPRSSLKHSELKKMLSYSQRESKGPLKIIFINSGHSKAKACGLDIDFYTPEGYSKDPNDSSPLIKFTLSSNFKVASLGDLSSKEFENLLWTHRKKFCEKVDLLKISHHGSKYSTSESHFTCFKPKTSIVSSSKNNTYGHPHPEVLNLIRKYKSKALLTSEIGNFTWLMNEPGIWNYQNSKD